MTFKDPEEELTEFLLAQPSWLRKILQLDYSLIPEERQAWQDSDSWWQGASGSVQAEYERILQRIPPRWREYCKKRRQDALTGVPSVPPGRPKRDAFAEEAEELRRAGKSYAEIADQLREKYASTSPKGRREPTPEGIRKLLDSRKPRCSDKT